MSQQINLYNAAFLPPREWITARGLALAVALASALVVVGGVAANRFDARTAADLLAAKAERTQAQAQFDAARAQLAAAKPSAQLQEKLAAVQARIALRERILDATQLSLSEPGSGFSRYLTGLARQGVPGLWLNQLVVDGGASSLTLAGQTVRQEALPEYVRRLKGEPVFAGRTFAGIDMAVALAEGEAATAASVAPATGAVPPAPTLGAVTSTAVPPINFTLVATRDSTGASAVRQP